MVAYIHQQWGFPPRMILQGSIVGGYGQIMSNRCQIHYSLFNFVKSPLFSPNFSQFLMLKSFKIPIYNQIHGLCVVFPASDS